MYLQAVNALRKKKQVAMEKQKRKRERELKKKEKEEKQKRKAAEKACKAAEREAEKVRKETEKAERAKEKARKVQEKSVKTGEKRSSCGNDMENSSCPKRKRRENYMDTIINTDECCVYLDTYHEDLDIDRQGLECCCGRWIHEDCVDSEDIDNSTRRLCPLC